MPIWIFFFLLAVLNSGCSFVSEDPVAGGSDHPNEIIGSAIVNDQPLAGAKVTLYKIDEPAKILLKTATTYTYTLDQIETTNSKGHFTFKEVSPGTYQVEILSSDSTVISLSEILQKTDSGLDLKGIELTPSTSLNGIIIGNDIPESIMLLNTPYQSLVSPDGHFNFPIIPNQMYQIAEADHGFVLAQVPADHQPQDTLKIYSSTPTAILLDSNDNNAIIKARLGDSLLVSLSPIWPYEKSDIPGEINTADFFTTSQWPNQRDSIEGAPINLNLAYVVNESGSFRYGTRIQNFEHGSFDFALNIEVFTDNILPLVLQQNNHESKVILHTGDNLIIVLPQNASTGYEWVPSAQNSETLNLNITQDPSSTSNVPGASSLINVHLRPEALGEYNLVLSYQRPWDIETEIDSFKITLKVL
jgi:predicted secreted protein